MMGVFGSISCSCDIRLYYKNDIFKVPNDACRGHRSTFERFCAQKLSPECLPTCAMLDDVTWYWKKKMSPMGVPLLRRIYKKPMVRTTILMYMHSLAQPVYLCPFSLAQISLFLDKNQNSLLCILFFWWRRLGPRFSGARLRVGFGVVGSLDSCWCWVFVFGQWLLLLGFD